MLYDNKNINSYASIRIQLFNYSDKAYTDIPVHIHIESDPEDTIRLVDNVALGNSGMEESVKIIKADTLAPNGELNLSYITSVANKADSLGNYIFDVQLMVLCKNKPSVKIGIDKDGLNLVDFEAQHFYKPKWWEKDIIFWPIMIFLYGIILFGVIHIRNIFHDKHISRLRRYQTKALEEAIQKGEITLDSESIVSIMSKTRDYFNYRESWKITRIINRMKPPEGYHEEEI